MELADLARQSDTRGIKLDRAGVRGFHMPLQIRQKNNGFQWVLGDIDATVELPAHWRATHMSRFIEILNEWREKPISGGEIREILQQMTERFEAPGASLALRFKYFLKKRAPVSGIESMLDYQCEFLGELRGGKYDFVLGVTVPVIAVCPCSKEVADEGAHSQRALLRARIRSRPPLWIEDLVAILERQGSYEVFPLLKRPDEKHVTERSFAQPKFVEDIVRDAVVALREVPGMRTIEVTCESMESIHNHTAYAQTTVDLRR